MCPAAPQHHRRLPRPNDRRITSAQRCPATNASPHLATSSTPTGPRITTPLLEHLHPQDKARSPLNTCCPALSALQGPAMQGVRHGILISWMKSW